MADTELKYHVKGTDDAERAKGVFAQFREDLNEVWMCEPLADYLATKDA